MYRTAQSPGSVHEDSKDKSNRSRVVESVWLTACPGRRHVSRVVPLCCKPPKKNSTPSGCPVTSRRCTTACRTACRYAPSPRRSPRGHAGFTCQEVTHDYHKAFEAVIRCCNDYDWDATVANMVYVWTGLTQAAGLKYYGVPGIDVPADVCFQYREPADQTAFMKREEYDDLIADRSASSTRHGCPASHPISASADRP